MASLRATNLTDTVGPVKLRSMKLPCLEATPKCHHLSPRLLRSVIAPTMCVFSPPPSVGRERKAHKLHQGIHVFLKYRLSGRMPHRAISQKGDRMKTRPHRGPVCMMCITEHEAQSLWEKFTHVFQLKTEEADLTVIPPMVDTCILPSSVLCPVYEFWSFSGNIILWQTDPKVSWHSLDLPCSTFCTDPHGIWSFLMHQLLNLTLLPTFAFLVVFGWWHPQNKAAFYLW